MDLADAATSGAILRHHECVFEAAQVVLASTCGVHLETHELNESFAEDGVIMAVISLVGDVGWSLLLCLPRPTATGLAAKFAGFEIPFDSTDMGDAVGELTNILAGEVKARLDRLGVRADISLPSVMRGENTQFLGFPGTVMRQAGFSCPAGDLCVAVMTSE